MAAPELDLAVIIPCRNEAAHLREQLDALADQHWDGTWEVLLVDNGSTDRSVEIATSHSGLGSRLRVVDGAGLTCVAAVRRRGVEAARARAIVFCDGDDIVAPGWLKAFGDALATHDFVTGLVELDLLNPPELAATRGRRRLGRVPKFGEHTILSGGNGGMTIRGWDEFDGFDEHFVGLEDIELSLRLTAAGRHVEFVPEALLHYRYRANPKALWRQGRFYGASQVHLARRCRQLGIAAPDRHGWKSWIWLVLNLPRAPIRRYRLRWLWTLASRFGAATAVVRPAVGRATFTVRLWIARRPRRRRSPGERAPLHLVSIAFDNPPLVRCQLTMLRDCLAEPHSITVADNSTSATHRSEIESLCAEFGAEYFPLPRNPYTGRDPSRSHAEALNYVCRHLGNVDDVEVLGLLDHDVFPTPGTTVRGRMLDRWAYGRVLDGADFWYLWPGLMFLRLDRFPMRRLDFHPIRGQGDTGASIFTAGSEACSRDQIVETTSSYEHQQSLTFELHDSWIHTTNGSSWRGPTSNHAEVVEMLRLHGLRDRLAGG